MPSKSSNDDETVDDKLLWVRSDLAESPDERGDIILAAHRAKADLVIVRAEDLSRAKEIGAIRIGVVSSNGSPSDDITVLIPDPSPSGHEAGQVAMVSIASGSDQEKAIELAGIFATLVVDCQDWTVIPLENLVAACQKTGCQLMATVSSAEDAETALGVLERGVDGVVLQTRDVEQVGKTADIVRPGRNLIDLVEAEVEEIRSVGSGDRACVDTCSILDPGEGMLIGSQANGLILVHGETITTEYVEARPFRVNAGAIHSYILDIDDKTRYLSDLRSGDTSLVVGADGSTRPVTVGRIKIETRPLILIGVRSSDRSFRAILQDAETIRLVKPGGEAISVNDLKKGDKILAYVSGVARHFGMAVEEKLIER
ncbi:MAG: 3-dehydroquinate synthase II [Theionarchaea archaeon]|nr:3-dehydroquinate synthase II [Theionarchaea archaeon]